MHNITQEKGVNYMLTVETAMDLRGLHGNNIRWNKKVDHNKQSHYWHNGQLCSIEFAGVTFSIEAVGDICFYLLEKGTGRQLVHVEDRIGTNALEDELRRYIKTDNELFKALSGSHPTYEAIFDENNWYECVIFYKEEEIESYVLEDEKLVNGILEVRSNMIQSSTDIILASLPF